MSGPNIQGSITINTKSIDDAVKAINDFSSRMEGFTSSLERATKSVNSVMEKQNSVIQQGNRVKEQSAKVTQETTRAVQRESDAQQRAANAIARATARVATFDQAVRKKTQSGERQNRILIESRTILGQYAQAITQAAGNTTQMDTANTQFSVSMQRIQRDMANATKSVQNNSNALVQQENILGRNDVALVRLTSRVQSSALTDAQKAQALARLTQETNRYNAVIKNTSSSAIQVAAAKRRYNVETQKLTQSVAAANRSFRGQEVEAMTTKFRNLTSSVQVALGPLSGIAARMTALTTLFNRNTVSAAAAFATMTLFGVGLSKTINYIRDAEQAMFQLESIITSLGDETVFTMERMNVAAHEFAADTLGSAADFRKAAGVILQSSSMTEDQLKRTTIIAQGLSQQFGGDIASNARLLARALADPAAAATQLRRKGLELDQSIVQQIQTFRAAGDEIQATETLLQALSTQYDVAINSAKGLAGAQDAVRGAIDKLFEAISEGSGLIETVTEQTNNFVTILNDFAESNSAEMIGASFNKMAEFLGRAFNFLVRNIDTIAVLMVALVTSTIPKLIAIFVRLSATMLFLGGAYTTATQRLRQYTAAKQASIVTARGFAQALLRFAGPIGVIVTGLTAAVAVQRMFNRESNKLDEFQGEIANQIARSIRMVQGLTSAERDNYQLQLERLAAQKEQYEAHAEQARAAIRSAMEQLKAQRAVSQGFLAGIRYSQRQREEAMAAAAETRVRIRQLKEDYEFFTQAIGDSAAAMGDLLEEVRGSGGESTIIQRSTKALRDMLDEANLVSDQIDTLRGNIAALEGMITNLGSQMTVEDLNRANELLNRLRGDLARLNGEAARSKELERLAEDSAKAFSKLSSVLADTSNKVAVSLDRMFGTTNADPLYDFNKAFADISNSINQLTQNDLKQFEQALISNGVQLDNTVSLQERVTQGLYQWMLQQQKVTQSINNTLAAQARLDDHFAQSGSQIEQLQARYAALMDDAFMSGSEDQMGALFDQLEAEERAMMAHVAELHRIGEMGQMSEMERLRADYDMRLDMLEDFLGKEHHLYAEQRDKLEEAFNLQAVFLKQSQAASDMSNVVGGAMDAMTAAGLESSKAFQAMSVVQAVIQGYQAVLGVWSDPNMSTWAKFGMAATVGAKVGAQIAGIKAQSFSTGGFVSGKGTSTSDSIPAWLSDGEFIMNARAVQKIGRSNLEAMNRNQMPAFKSGGGVGMLSTRQNTGSYSGSNVNIQIIDQSRGVDIETTSETDADGVLQIRSVIKEQFKDSLRRGEFDNDMSTRFGLQRRGAMR